jgi:hypothetical protein
LLSLLLACPSARAEPARGDVVFRADFEGAEALRGWETGDGRGVALAPGQSACNYLRDVIDLAEEYGWDWAYHAFREWDGWSVEHGPDPKDHGPSRTPTDREKLLRSWYGKDRKPGK